MRTKPYLGRITGNSDITQLGCAADNTSRARASLRATTFPARREHLSWCARRLDRPMQHHLIRQYFALAPNWRIKVKTEPHCLPPNELKALSRKRAEELVTSRLTDAEKTESNS